MKNKMNTRIQSRALPIGCFIILLLNINLGFNSLFASSNHTHKLSFWLSSVVDSSGNNLLSVNYILNNNHLEIEKEFQLENWMTQSDSYQYPDISDTYNNSLSAEAEYNFENWMSNPDSFLNNDFQDTAGDAIQKEEEIKFENWMINTSSWVEVHLCH